jgi:uncharacterized protein (DUF1697 family)
LDREEETVTYIAFLRAINVAGRTVKMARLRELFAELGFAKVRSHIQSGNVFFETDETDRALLTGMIAGHLLQTLGYEVGVFLRTIPEVEQIFALDPFKEVEVTPDIRLCVVFAEGPLPRDLALPLWSPKRDVTIVGLTDGEILCVYHLVDGRMGDPARSIAATCNLRSLKSTTRFYGTTAKILEAARQV